MRHWGCLGSVGEGQPHPSTSAPSRSIPFRQWAGGVVVDCETPPRTRLREGARPEGAFIYTRSIGEVEAWRHQPGEVSARRRSPAKPGEKLSRCAALAGKLIGTCNGGKGFSRSAGACTLGTGVVMKDVVVRTIRIVGREGMEDFGVFRGESATQAAMRWLNDHPESQMSFLDGDEGERPSSRVWALVSSVGFRAMSVSRTILKSRPLGASRRDSTPRDRGVRLT